jgi:hypothetical protein
MSWRSQRYRAWEVGLKRKPILCSFARNDKIKQQLANFREISLLDHFRFREIVSFSRKFLRKLLFSRNFPPKNVRKIYQNYFMSKNFRFCINIRFCENFRINFCFRDIFSHIFSFSHIFCENTKTNIFVSTLVGGSFL